MFGFIKKIGKKIFPKHTAMGKLFGSTRTSKGAIQRSADRQELAAYRSGSIAQPIFKPQQPSATTPNPFGIPQSSTGSAKSSSTAGTTGTALNLSNPLVIGGLALVAYLILKK